MSPKVPPNERSVRVSGARPIEPAGAVFGSVAQLTGYKSSASGVSMCFLNDLSQVAPMEPSTTRWSLESVTVMMLLTMKGLVAASGPSLATTFFSVPPTARMHACGALMMAVNCLMPNMPRLETVKVPPMNSSGLMEPSLALPARCLTSLEISATDLVSAPKMMGVSSPRSVLTATLMSAAEYCRMYSSLQLELHTGTSTRALAHALMTKSLTEVLTSTSSLTCARIAMSSSMQISIVR
mmetsp:Transcript_1425/g.3501  ORF Transcript_1425/g.3501 Transcript_1425/m.3501 type:complete len:239 (+) Transcript_1425:132-848(+)